MRRRDLLMTGVATLALPMSTPSQIKDDPVVATASGRVRGLREGSVLTFKGVPYGGSTAGEGRFMPPRPPQPWSGIRDALAFGPSAPQTNPNPAQRPSRIILGQLAATASRAAPVPRAAPAARPPESEDCLVLNIWTSGLSDGRKRPVMVRLHGGFFSASSGSTVDGHALAARGDVVVVSLNHRLNVFGFAHLADLAGSEFAHSGNVGMLDVLAALQWIREHIDRFGGDPHRVMVFGESGGGMKTCFLLGSPAAQGLFHRAGVESGPALRFTERAAAAHASELLLRELGLTAAQSPDMKFLPAERLLAAYFAVMSQLPPLNFTEMVGFCPVLDPVYLPEHPFSPRATNLSAKVPLLIGWNRSDMSFFMGDDSPGFELDDGGLRQRLSRFFGSRTEEAIALYRQAMPQASLSDIYICAWTDYSIGAPTVWLAERKAARRAAPVYLYRFDWGSPALGGKLGATHTLEVPFIFDTVQNSALAGGGAEAQTLADEMSETWVRFAADGDPNSGRSHAPHWPAFESGGERLLAFNAANRVEDVDPRRLALLRGVLAE